MSGQTVTGEGLQFTDDNLQCYAYSGSVTIAAAESTIIDFETNSSYINAIVTPFYVDNSSNDLIWQAKINGLTIAAFILPAGNAYPGDFMNIIIPPNSRFTVHAQNLSAGSIQGGVAIVGKVGMPQRVGNLVE